MTYSVKFREDAFKEWKKLDKSIQQQFAKKLKKCCVEPHIPSAKLRGMPNCYKIKLRASGFRLVYEVMDNVLIIAVVAVGKHERSEAYELASKRLGKQTTL
ncbi:type II toxin-antitoxin system RelE family toxin [Photorhabdus aegyptia]|uniref:Addiction module toxin, RelE/StbE family n=1 Tax=Photorhabdus aegyptia TaxID=2805098 RepID=A0A022PHL9_9GAMM|nr:type II toxin-antitoxin system RelE/ParE family toxin [Photorhabdus aegyptia]EYU14398.1 addiction module toxin, RelE/StbE family [Photorhabdus aegyptia]